METYARRIRGEIFFAERWFIVEGQADYLLVHAIAHALNYELDRHGVSVIDAQNNGNPATFTALARALDIPWLAVFDGDTEGKGFIHRIKSRGFSDAELEKRCRTHPCGTLEEQLIADGLGDELREVLLAIGVEGAQVLSDDKTVQALKRNKRIYAAELAARMRGSADLATQSPSAFRDAIERFRGLS